MTTLWTPQEQEQEGDYFFAGQAYLTRAVYEQLPFTDVLMITAEIRRLVQEHKGLDYLQVFRHPDGRKILCIDQISKYLLQGGSLSQEERHQFNFWTMRFAEEG